MANQVEVNYEMLKGISDRFNQLAGFVETMKKDVDGKVDSLRETGWQGKGSDAFYREMNDEVSPAVQRLQAALQKSTETINAVTQTIREAEEEVQGNFQSRRS